MSVSIFSCFFCCSSNCVVNHSAVRFLIVNPIGVLVCVGVSGSGEGEHDVSVGSVGERGVSRGGVGERGVSGGGGGEHGIAGDGEGER